jgi:hypothetical protein
MFELLRKSSAEVFNLTENSDWDKTGLHPQKGEISLRTILELYAEHVERHLEQILQRRNLIGKLLEMNLLLTERLY